MTYLGAAAVLASVLALCACTTGPSDLAATQDAGPTCVPDGGVYMCLGGSYPVCPSSAGPSLACAPGPECMGCRQGEGFTCTCSDAGAPGPDAAGGPWWFCVGTEYACE